MESWNLAVPFVALQRATFGSLATTAEELPNQAHRAWYGAGLISKEKTLLNYGLTMAN